MTIPTNKSTANSRETTKKPKNEPTKITPALSKIAAKNINNKVTIDE